MLPQLLACNSSHLHGMSKAFLTMLDQDPATKRTATQNQLIQNYLKENQSRAAIQEKRLLERRQQVHSHKAALTRLSTIDRIQQLRDSTQLLLALSTHPAVPHSTHPA